VNTNIFQLYDRTTTQFSEFDPSSIMLYSVPASLTTNGYSTPWNRELSETDKTFIGETYPNEGPDTGSFSTTEVRTKAARSAVKRQVFAERLEVPPVLAIGLTSVDIAPTTNIRVTAYADKITTTTADVHINTWDDTTLFSAAATWFRAAADDPDFQLGQASTLDSGRPQQPQTAIPITFERPYAAPPQVVVWLNRFEMGYETNWRVAASASDVTARGFVLHLDSAGDTTLLSASAAWIAFPAAKAGVAGGSFSTSDVRRWDQPEPVTRGQIRFPQRGFATPPSRVLVALNSLDMAAGHCLRLKVSAEKQSAQGAAWQIETWGGDSILYSAGASYLALA